MGLKSINPRLKTLMGHIDLLIIDGDTLYVCDYKPDQQHNSKSTPYKSFINSVPQIATYALILKEMFGITNLKCITFNQRGAWLYEPVTVLKSITQFMQGVREDADLPWNDYFPDILD